MFEYLGTSGNYSLFSNGDKAVIVDAQLNLVTRSGSLSTMQAEFSTDSYQIPSAETIDLVNDHFIIPNLKSVVAAGDGSRMYTIPGGVQAEAKKALNWRREAKRGGTPVGLNTARTLAKGGQIGIEKIRHIAKYFPRHEVDKKGKGWEPGEEHFPSNGRIAWALWGGDAGQRWASTIVERENKKALTAGAYGIPGYEDVVEDYGRPANGFQDAYEMGENQGPEFIARVRHDARGIDRLYMIDVNAEVYVWDGGAWDSLGDVGGDIYTYDRSLDDAYDLCEKTHVMIDPESALILAARFVENDYGPVSLDEINEEEAYLAAQAIEGVDWRLVEHAMLASGDKEDTTGLTAKIKPIDTTGILGESRLSEDYSIAKLSVAIPALTASELKDTLTSWTVYVLQTRKNNKAQNLVAAAEMPAATPMTPETTDVPAKYLAIVSPDDLQAVMDVVAIVPSSDKSTAPTTYRRQDKAWVQDNQVLADLKSATPPPVIKLDTSELLNDVLAQADGIKATTASGRSLAPLWKRDIVSLIASLSAAGGADRNRGNAEDLRRYWTSGKGAAKIRWGTPGDWTRCVRQLSKYMGNRAKGYCQLRHKDATGIYTGSRSNPGNNNRASFSTVEEFDSAIIETAILTARANDARSKFSITASADTEVISASGSRFVIPLLVPEGVESGDGRKFKSNAIEIRELPLPLLWQIRTGEGHDGSVVVGRIDKLERIEGGLGNAEGVFDSGPYGREAERLVRGGFLRGVSVDLDQFEAEEDASPENAEDSGEDLTKKKMTINHARVMAATIVAKPAFQECSIELSVGEF